MSNYYGFDEYEQPTTKHTLIDTTGGLGGWFGECSCGWGTGPVDSQEIVLEDFVLHRRHRRGESD